MFIGSRVWLLCTACLLCSCSSVVIEEKGGGLEPTFSSGDVDTFSAWYLDFGYEVLSDLVSSVTENHPSVGAAKERIEQARIETRIRRSSRKPVVRVGVVGASDKWRVQRESQASVDRVDFNASAQWEADLRGALRAAVEVGVANERVAEVDLGRIKTALASEVVAGWLQFQSSIERIAIYESLVKDEVDQLALVDEMFRQGQASRLDLLEQEANLIALRARSLEAAEAKQAAYSRLLSLCGKDALGVAVVDKGRSFSVPSDLTIDMDTKSVLARRLDLRAVEGELAVRDAFLARALAERWPKLALGVDLQSSAGAISSLFESQLASLFAELLWDVFDGGRKELGIDLERSRVRELALLLAETSVAAVEEIELSLVREEYSKRGYASIVSALAVANERFREANERYLNGLESYDRLLAAKIREQELRVELSERKLALGIARLELMLAIGWQEG